MEDITEMLIFKHNDFLIQRTTANVVQSKNHYRPSLRSAV